MYARGTWTWPWTESPAWPRSPTTGQASPSWSSACRRSRRRGSWSKATGGYEEPLLEACCDAGLWIARVNPRQARAFASAAGELAKTDEIDARILALMARLFAGRLRPYIATPSWQRELRD